MPPTPLVPFHGYLEIKRGLSISVYLGRNQMGGYGSGRPGRHITCEAGLKIDLADPAIRKALNPNSIMAGSWAWSSHGREIASIGYAWSPRDAQLLLRYNCSGAPIVQRIKLTQSTPRFGGNRWWFCCPFTGRRVRALFLPPGAREFGSRHAYKLTYQSQREGGSDRSMMRFLMRGGWPGDPGLVRAALNDPDPFGFREEARWERREKGRRRRNEVRRITRLWRTTGASTSVSR